MSALFCLGFAIASVHYTSGDNSPIDLQMRLVPLIALLALVAIPCQADRAPFYADSKYNDAEYGFYVTQTFKSSPQVTGVPVVNFMEPFTRCDDGSYLLITPRGKVAESTPMILDVNGSLVWAATKKYGQVYNLQVQSYKGQEYLTFWAGDDTVGGHGVGIHYMLDQQYREQYRIKAANGLGADLHAFTITANDTALISIYDKKFADVESMPGYHRKGWIWDSVFQELDLQTGEAIFEWRASDHIDVSKSYHPIGEMEESDPRDVYHINSVRKDTLGNFLVSSRYLRAVLYIDGITGKVLWQLGGKDNSFHDLSNGTATTFLGQHDADILERENVHNHAKKTHFITFFNNNADWDNTTDIQSKGARIEISLDDMTARLDLSLSTSNSTTTTRPILSSSQGSYQTLPNGHIVLGYGFNAAMAEFSETGELLCSMLFQPSSRFDTGDVQSYRNLRFNWTGFPRDTKPRLVSEVDGSSSSSSSSSSEGDVKLYMSWNGATEVSRWLLEGFENNKNNDEEEENETTEQRKRPSRTNHRNNSVEKISLVAKEGFETIYRISSSSKTISHKTRFVRVVALDRDDKVLGISDLIDLRGMDRDDEDGGIIDNSQQGEEEEGEKNFPFKLTNTDILLISFVGLLISLSFKFIFAFTAMGGRGRRKGRSRGGSKDKDKEMQEQEQQQDKKKKKQKSKYKYSLLLQ